MNHFELEDLEKFESLKYAKENKVWFQDFYALGNMNLVGGHEHTLVLNTNKKTVYKSNNLMNSRNLVSNVLEKVTIHNKLFPETKYSIVGYTGLDNGKTRSPHIEVILKQNYFPNLMKSEPREIKSYMESLGFKQTTPESYVNENYLVFDLFPRNVLKDSLGGYYVVDAEFRDIKKLEEEKMVIDIEGLKKAFMSIEKNQLSKTNYLTKEHKNNSLKVLEYFNNIDFKKIDWKKEIERQKINAVD